MEFTERIQSVLDERHITIKEMCKDIGLSQQTYFNWKKGTQIPLDKALQIIKYLELSADEVFEIPVKKNEIVVNQNKDWKLEFALKKIKHDMDYIISSNDIREIHELTKGMQMFIEKELSDKE